MDALPEDIAILSTHKYTSQHVDRVRFRTIKLPQIFREARVCERRIMLLSEDFPELVELVVAGAIGASTSSVTTRAIS